MNMGDILNFNNIEVWGLEKNSKPSLIALKKMSPSLWGDKAKFF